MAMNTGAWETMSYNDYQLNNLNRSFLDTRFQRRQFLSDYYLENASFLKMDNLCPSPSRSAYKPSIGRPVS